MADNKQLQELLDKGGDVIIPTGAYEIDVKDSLQVRSNTKLYLQNVILKAIPNNLEKFEIVRVSGVDNVTITGGTIQGERDNHLGTTGQWGMGIKINQGSKNITLQDTITRDCWGDGIYISDATDVYIKDVISDNNRRQGMSVIAVNGLTVIGSTFQNTKGTRPSDGIDLEPDNSEDIIQKVTISNNNFLRNAGAGIEIAGKRGTVKNVVIRGNNFLGQQPLKIGGVPGASKYQPSWVAQIFGFFGIWDMYPTEAIIT